MMKLKLKSVLYVLFLLFANTTFSINSSFKVVELPLNTKSRLNIVCESSLERTYSNSTLRVDNGVIYTFSADQITKLSDGLYRSSYVGQYYCSGQVPGNSGNTTVLPSGINAGYTFYDNCGIIEIETQYLAQAFSNEVSQSAGQRALSNVNVFTGVITIHYSIGFTDNTILREYITTLTPIIQNEIIYQWVFNEGIEDQVPLTNLYSNYELPVEGVLEFQSCLVGYPFNNANPNWRKAAMERRNNETNINYFSETNNAILYANANIKGIQITQPFMNNGMENTMIFNLSSLGFENLKFAFAAKNELAADGIIVDYSVSAGNPIWITSGLNSSAFTLSSLYQYYMVDFSNVASSDNNINLKIRIRFTGSNMTEDLGNRVTFNNISVHGVSMPLSIPENQAFGFKVFPNPTSDVINIAHTYAEVHFNLYSVEGRVIQSGLLDSSRINIENLPKGMYLLQLDAEGKTEIKKIIKK